MKNMLNIGCGHRFHKDWENIDVNPASPQVKKVNIINGLPYADNSFDVVYHSNVLEHLPLKYGKKLAAECYRVLKPEGILRINVPDLEKMCREYLYQMERAIKGDAMAIHNYNWILIEIFDQVSRNTSGGEMANYLSQEEIPNIDFLRKRLGGYVDNWRKMMKQSAERKSFLEKIRFVIRHPDRLKKIWHNIVLSKEERNYLNIGRFRMAGEIHYHMYDRFSLEMLLQQSGFQHITLKTPVTSDIENWSSYNLDSADDGAAILMEAVK